VFVRSIVASSAASRPLPEADRPEFVTAPDRVRTTGLVRLRELVTAPSLMTAPPGS